jgi:peroxiredoxin Q/BCP
MVFASRYLAYAMIAVLLPLPPLRGDVVEVHYFLRVGDKAPAFSAIDDQGKKWTSTTHARKKILVLYFYEGDFMPNCTRQAREMQAVLGQLRAQGAEVVGISGDTPANHERFKETNKLSFPLLSDEKGTLAHRFGVSRSGGGVLRIKDADGDEIEIRRGMTPGRWTFIIDREGNVAYKKTDVVPAGHAREVLNFVRRLALRR